MSKKLKSPAQTNKIHEKKDNIGECFSDQYPWFSFKDITANSRYNLKLLSGKEAELTLQGLYQKLQELSSKPWLYWMGMPKSTGLETISYQDIGFKVDANLSKDTTLYVFRFDTYQGHNKGRIIGYKNAPCSVLHVIGFDIDFSSYEH